MTFARTAICAAVALAALSATPSSANSLTFQGVTFETMALDADSLQLSILNADAATGNWTGVNFLSAFEIKDIGTVTGASLAGWTSTVTNGLANAGCTTGGTPGACFSISPAMALTDTMVFAIDFVGTNLDFSSPHLKVNFLTGINDRTATGDLLSQNITAAVPEPETYALMLAGLGALGLMSKRRRKV